MKKLDVKIAVSHKKVLSESTGEEVYDFVDLGFVLCNIFLKYNYINITDTQLKNVEKIYDWVLENYPSENYYYISATESIQWQGFDKFYNFLIEYCNSRGIIDKFKIFENNLGLIPTDKFKYYNSFPGMLTWNNWECVQYTPLSERNIEKNFISLNRRYKRHRFELIKFINDENITDKFYYSFLGEDNNDPLKKTVDMENVNDGMVTSWELPSDLNIKCFCDVVTESSDDSILNIPRDSMFKDYFKRPYGRIHITEKLGKPLVIGQPFLLLGGPGYIEKLHELGFKTFDKWWDESYDSVWDYETRRDMVYDIIIEISKWDIEKCKRVMLEMEDILIHNHNNMQRLREKYKPFTLCAVKPIPLAYGSLENELIIKKEGE